MSLAEILVAGALALPPTSLLMVVQHHAVIQENTPQSGTSPENPQKDEPQQAPPNGSPSEPSQLAPSTPEAGSQESTAPEPAAQPQAPPAKPAAKPPAKTHKKKSTTSASSPTKRVVHNGSAPDPTVQLAPSVSQNQASHELQNTSQLLAATDSNLKQISGRQLNPSQQNVVSQIRRYMEQSKQAADQGDPERAHNLAVKAHLLSDDLVKH